MQAEMISIENAILGIVGIALGLAFGYILALQYMSMFESDFLSLRFVIYARTYAISIAAIVIVMVVSQLPSLRHVGRLNLAKTIKEQSV